MAVDIAASLRRIGKPCLRESEELPQQSQREWKKGLLKEVAQILDAINRPYFAEKVEYQIRQVVTNHLDLNNVGIIKGAIKGNLLGLFCLMEELNETRLTSLDFLQKEWTELCQTAQKVSDILCSKNEKIGKLEALSVQLASQGRTLEAVALADFIAQKFPHRLSEHPLVHLPTNLAKIRHYEAAFLLSMSIYDRSIQTFLPGLSFSEKYFYPGKCFFNLSNVLAENGHIDQAILVLPDFLKNGDEYFRQMVLLFCAKKDAASAEKLVEESRKSPVEKGYEKVQILVDCGRLKDAARRLRTFDKDHLFLREASGQLFYALVRRRKSEEIIEKTLHYLKNIEGDNLLFLKRDILNWREGKPPQEAYQASLMYYNE